MSGQVHNLGRPWARERKVLYGSAAGLAVVFAVLAAIGVMLKLLPPTPTDIVCSSVIFVLLFVPFAAFRDAPGEQRTPLERAAEYTCVWLFLSGVIQVGWELAWALMELAGWMHGLGPDDTWGWFWWVYGVADTRYIKSDHAVFGIESMAGLTGPLELYAWWLYVYGKTDEQRLKACWLSFAGGIGLVYTTGIYFLSEWHAGWVNIEQGAVGFWLKFVGMNGPWLVAPFITIPALVRQIEYLYQSGAAGCAPTRS